jgi:hypothetical protein
MTVLVRGGIIYFRLKKISGVLLAAAVVVSLGVVTVAPVTAVTMPGISPTSALYDLDAPAQVTTTVTWGGATDLEKVVELGGLPLSEGATHDWVQYDDLVVITKDYLANELTFVGDSVTLVFVFDVGVCTFTITATKTSPAVSPTSATWVYGSDDGVSTTILWGPCEGSTVTVYGLNETAGDYDQFGDLLVINASYLNSDASGIDGVDDYKAFSIYFYDGGDLCGVAFFTVVATGDGPSCSPASTTWQIGSGAVATTMITFNSATDEGFNVAKEGVGIGDANWDLFGTLLVIDDGYLEGQLSEEGDTLALVLDFDFGECLFTITGMRLDTPSLSPDKSTYEMGSCNNVTFTINWAGVADSITDVQDVTTLTKPIDLVEGAGDDYEVSGNTLILHGCSSNDTDWDGFECMFDAMSRLSRIIEVTFDDADNTQVQVVVTPTGLTAPTLSSTALSYDLDSVDDPLYEYVGAIVTWGTATGIDRICEWDEDAGDYGCNLSATQLNYMISYSEDDGGWLLLFTKAGYLALPDTVDMSGYMCGSGLQEIGEEVELVIFWAPANDDCGNGGTGTSYPYKYTPTRITITAVGTSASISPSKVDVDLDEDVDVNEPGTQLGNVTVEIEWGPHATDLLEITCAFDTLDEGTDFIFEDYVAPADPGEEPENSKLTISGTYLAEKLKNIGDTTVLDVEFDHGENAKLTIQAIGTPFCFIATAAYGTPAAEEINILREFRDEVLRPSRLGAELVSLYYKTSPPIAEFIFQSEALRAAVRVGFIDPIVAILNWSHGLWS